MTLTSRRQFKAGPSATAHIKLQTAAITIISAIYFHTILPTHSIFHWKQVRWLPKSVRLSACGCVQSPHRRPASPHQISQVQHWFQLVILGQKQSLKRSCADERHKLSWDRQRDEQQTWWWWGQRDKGGEGERCGAGAQRLQPAPGT